MYQTKINPSCLNIEGGRVETKEKLSRPFGYGGIGCKQLNLPKGFITGENLKGRYPSALFCDSFCEKLLDEQNKINLGNGNIKYSYHTPLKNIAMKGDNLGHTTLSNYGDTGGCSKIFHICDYVEEEFLLTKSDYINIINLEDKVNINNRDVLEDIKGFKDYSMNLIFSDPPYNLSSKIYIGKDGKVKFKQAKDFMDKWSFDCEKWEDFFKESFRVLKYGGYCVLFCIDRQTLPLEYYASLAGFEICQHLYWYNISGFPKNLDVSKAIDRRLGKEREVIGTKLGLPGYSLAENKADRQIYGQFIDSEKECNITKPNSELAKQWEGYKSGIAPLKPCIETILIFRKPTKNGNYIDDILEYNENINPSAVNIDESRIPLNMEIDKSQIRTMNRNKKIEENGWGMNKNSSDIPLVVREDGRYPSQLYVDDAVVKLLDKQSGDLKSGECKDTYISKESENLAMSGKNYERPMINRQSNIGGCSKILHICNYDSEEIEYIFYNPKVSVHERNAGCENLEDRTKIEKYERCDNKCKICGKNFLSSNPCICDESIFGKKPERLQNFISKNNHPCLKPMSLIQKIAILFKLPIEDQKVYLPFSGVGSELIGFLAAGYKEANLFACEKDPNYIKIAQARIQYWKDNDFYFKNNYENKPKKPIKKEDKNLPNLF